MAAVTRRFLLAGAAAASLAAAAASFTPGNVAISRVGAVNGPVASVLTQAVFIDEYTPAGALVQSVALPTSFGAAPTANAATLPGQNPLICLAASANGMAGTAGLLTRSTNGQWLSLITLGQTLNTPFNGSTTPNWPIARVAVNGSVDTTTVVGAHHSVS